MSGSDTDSPCPAPTLTPRAAAPQLKQFFTTNAALLSSAEREAKQAVEYSTTNVAWMAKNYDTIVRWLKERERR